MSQPTLKPFDQTDLERVVTARDKLVMVETILAWADLDTAISRFILLVFGLEDDAGSILIGNMDLKTKIEKIKVLHAHHGNVKSAESLTKLIATMKTFSECRNAIAHRKCIGRLRSQTTGLVFLSARHVKGAPGQFEMMCIDRTEMVASSKFARRTAVKINEMSAKIDS